MTTDVSGWLRRETPKHLDLLTRMREKLEQSLTARTEPDADGNALLVPADLNESGTPSRDWCRAYQRYATGYTTLLAEERERAKLRLLATRQGAQMLSDEEYETEMRQLAVESVRELTTDELERELASRRQLIVGVTDPD